MSGARKTTAAEERSEALRCYRCKKRAAWAALCAFSVAFVASVTANPSVAWPFLIVGALGLCASTRYETRERKAWLRWAVKDIVESERARVKP